MFRQWFYIGFLLMGLVFASPIHSIEVINVTRDLETENDIILCDESAEIYLDHVRLISTQGNIYILGKLLTLQNSVQLSAKGIYLVSLDGPVCKELQRKCSIITNVSLRLESLWTDGSLYICPNPDFQKEYFQGMLDQRIISPEVQDICVINSGN